MKRVTISRLKTNRDFYVVNGGKWKPVLVMSKSRAKEIADARRRLIKKSRR